MRVLFVLLLLPAFSVAQQILPVEVFPDTTFPVEQSIGWHGTGKYDTVPVKILTSIGTRVMVIQGYVQRELHTYYGDIDPYIMAGYKQPADRYIETDIFIDKYSKKIIPKEWVWMHRLINE